MGTAATLAVVFTAFDVQRFIGNVQQAAQVIALQQVFRSDDLGIARCRIHQARNALQVPSIGNGKLGMRMMKAKFGVLISAISAISALLVTHTSS